MEKVKQERRIELCFEEHRYFDLRRWMDGNQLKEPIIGMKVEENASGLHYTRITVDEARNFKRLHVLSSYSSESNQGKPFHPTESRLVTGIKNYLIDRKHEKDNNIIHMLNQPPSGMSVHKPKLAELLKMPKEWR